MSALALDPFVTLTGLVEHYSPSGAEQDAVHWLVERMGALSYTRAFADPVGNAVGVLGCGPHQLVLLGHIDTVPGRIPVRIDGGRLYGRGAVDAKGPLAAFVDAAAQVGAVDGWRVVVIGAVDEERESLGARFVAGQYHPEFAIIGEPSRWDRVTLGYKGRAWAAIKVRRPLAHTAGQAQSACEAAVEVWIALRAWAGRFNQDRRRAFDQLLLTLRGLDSGSDGFEEWASLHVGARLPPDFAPTAWYARLSGLASAAIEESQVQVEPLGYSVPAYQAEKNTPLVRAFLAGIRFAHGTPGFVLKTGTADLNIVAPQWGCPALAYGPGDSSLDHTPDEHLVLEEYTRGVRVLRSVISNLLRSPVEGTENR